MANEAASAEEYIAGFDPDRRAQLGTVRDVINQHLPAGFEEQMDFGMITSAIPLSVYPGTYNGHPLGIAALASKNSHMAVYLTGLSTSESDEQWFREQYAQHALKLDMGKSCVRFRSLDQLALDVLGDVISKTTPEVVIARYEATRGAIRRSA